MDYWSYVIRRNAIIIFKQLHLYLTILIAKVTIIEMIDWIIYSFAYLSCLLLNTPILKYSQAA